MTEINVAEAARTIAIKKRLSEAAARRALVGGLMRGDLAAWAESFWATATTGGRVRYYVADDDPVPANFWRGGHATDRRFAEPGWTHVPSGAAGNYHDGRFVTRLALTAGAAARRFPEWEDLAAFGDVPALVEWTAIGVTVDRCDLEQLLERQSLGALIRAAATAPPLLPARGSAADFERLMARFVIWAARNGDHAVVALQSRLDLMMIAQSLADGDIDVRKIRRFVDQIIEEK